MAALDGRLQHGAGIEGHLVLERLEPALGRELGGPDDVDVDDVVAGVLGLEVLDEVIVLLVGLVGLLLEGDLLVRVRGVPLGDQRADDVAVVLALDVGDGTAAVQALRRRRRRRHRRPWCRPRRRHRPTGLGRERRQWRPGSKNLRGFHCWRLLAE